MKRPVSGIWQRLVIITLISCLGILGLNNATRAQDDDGSTTSDESFSVINGVSQDSDWGIPLNISRSGATSDPQMILDNQGRIHILWRDDLGGFVYSQGLGQTFSQPITIELPFATRSYFPDLREDEPTPLFSPKLIADNKGFIHVFWIGDDQVLYTSNVPAGDFATFSSWTPRAALDDGIIAVNGVDGSENDVQISYIRGLDANARPVGIYHRRLESSGDWTDPNIIYESRYLRSVTDGDGNLQLLALRGGNVYAVWDDPLLEKVYFASSNNHGIGWNDPVEIDSRSINDNLAAEGPKNIIIGADDNSLHLSWRAGHEVNESCSQYNTVSYDGGQTWSERESIDRVPGCFNFSQFISSDQALLLFGSTESDNIEASGALTGSYLAAWNGERWSNPQIQEYLSKFINVETNQPVFPRCYSLISDQNNLLVATCDVGTGQDVWILNYEIPALESWFPPPPIWKGPEKIDEGESVGPAAVKVVASEDGNVHAFWKEESSQEIYYALWDGQWNTGRAIARSPSGQVDDFDVASATGRIFLIWSDDAAGLYFNQAKLEDPFVWSERRQLAPPEDFATSPTIAVDRNGQITAGFAVQFNEPRGIYIRQSADFGANWSPAQRVFDGAAADWELVDHPQIEVSGSGSLHLLWTHRSLPPDDSTLGLAYMHSEDNGQTWSDLNMLVEGPASTSHIEVVGEGILHLMWTEETSGRQVVLHKPSVDGGLNWGEALQVANLSDKGLSAIAVDPAKRIHLLTLEQGSLQDTVMENQVWQQQEGLDTILGDGLSLAGAGNRAGLLFAVYSGLVAGQDEEGSNSLFAMNRQLELPSELPTPYPTLTPSPVPTSTPGPTATPWPTSTPLFSTEQAVDPIPTIPGLPDSFGNIFFGIIPAAIIVLILAGVGIWIVRKR